MPPVLQDARPSFKVAGQDQPALALGLLELTVRERRDGLASCVARFGALGTDEGTPDFQWMDRATLDFGAEIEVILQEEPIFKGKITALTGEFSAVGPPTLTVSAEDACQELRMTRRSRVFSGVTDADVVRRIAADHGRDANIVADDGRTWPQLGQLNESDLAFLRRRALLAGWDLWVADGRLHAVARDRWTDDPVLLTCPSELRAVEISADLAHQRTALRVGGWSVADRDGVTSEATAAAIASEATDGESGPAVLEAKLGARVEGVAHTLSGTSEATRAEAEALRRTLARRVGVADGGAAAGQRLGVGKRGDLRGVGPLFEGVYAVVAAELRFDQTTGATTTFQAERPWIGRAS